MTGSVMRGFDRQEYLELVAEFPPMKVTSEESAAATEDRIEELLCRKDMTEAEQAYLDLLSDLLSDWEDMNIEIPDIRGTELVRALLDERGLRRKDLVGIFATESVASEVLAGRRQLTRGHIEGLARFFHVSPAAFFPAADVGIHRKRARSSIRPRGRPASSNQE